MIPLEKILQDVARISIPGFFITVEFSAEGDDLPGGIEAFLRKKHRSILEGAAGRKFAYRENGWRLIFTFFPTGSVVEERYALKNKVQMKK